MPLYELERYLFRLKNDPAMQAALKDDPAGHLAQQPLDEEQRTALRDRDVAALWRMGVHPLLLVPYSRFVGMPVPEYRQRLAPLVGQRSFRS